MLNNSSLRVLGTGGAGDKGEAISDCRLLRAAAAAAALAMTIAVFSFLTPFAQASSLAPEGTAERKFQRGLLNVAFAPVELSTALAEGQEKDKWVPTWFPGLIKGSIMTVARASTGVWDILTAPFASPPDHRSALEPELALDQLPPFAE